MKLCRIAISFRNPLHNSFRKQNRIHILSVTSGKTSSEAEKK